MQEISDHFVEDLVELYRHREVVEALRERESKRVGREGDGVLLAASKMSGCDNDDELEGAGERPASNSSNRESFISSRSHSLVKPELKIHTPRRSGVDMDLLNFDLS